VPGIFVKPVSQLIPQPGWAKLLRIRKRKGKHQTRIGENMIKIGENMTKVLVVDDTPSNKDLVLEILIGEGFAAHVAEDGAEAIKMAEKELYDLILMDLKLPDADGIEVTRTIKSNRAYKDVPVIALTAHAMKGDKERILNEGCFDDYMSKPIDMPEFIERMEKYRTK
jgi:CheY-like chemotaxis protein